MNINFSTDKVLITGGSRGIGKQIATSFLSAGVGEITITGKSKEVPKWISEVVTYKEANIDYRQLDLLSGGWYDDFSSWVESKGGYDICINNAGINYVEYLPDFPRDRMKEILAVNLEAPMLVSSIVSKQMKIKEYGKIVNISSIFGVVSKEKRSAYTASKAGLIGVTKTMALDLAKYNIMVNSIAPGVIDTALTRQILGEEGISTMQAKIPVRRLGRSEEIAKFVLFIASSHNTYMTGQNIIVDGGYTCE